MTDDRTPLEAATRAFRAGDYETVIRTVRGANDTSVELLRLARDAFWKTGELQRAIGAVNRLRMVTGDAKFDKDSRSLLGRIIESDPAWSPALPARPTPEPVPGRVLHVLKESLPYAESGFTFRNRMTFAAQRLAGLDPHVVTSLGFPATKGTPNAPNEEQVDDTPHHRLPHDPEVVSSMPFDVLTQRTAVRTAELAHDIRPSLVQAGTGYRGFETALTAMAVAEDLDVPYVYEVRGFQEQTWTSEGDRSERGEYFHRRHRQENRCMREASAVITIAHAMADEILRRGVPEDRLNVVPNAVDVERFTPREKSPELMRRYGLEDRVVVGYVSNLGQREGIDQLLRAVDLLRRRIPDVVCFIAGDGPERSRLEELVQHLGLDDHAVLAGHVPNTQIEDHYALIDAFVVPRIDDRASRLVTPLKPLEAMSMRLPVAVSALPALEELVEPGVRGLSFPPSDPNAMAEVIETLINDTRQRDDFASAGHAWVRAERTLESNAIRYGEILTPLMGG